VKHAGVDLKSTRTSGEITIEADTLDTLRIDILMEIKQKKLFMPAYSLSLLPKLREQDDTREFSVV